MVASMTVPAGLYQALLCSYLTSPAETRLQHPHLCLALILPCTSQAPVYISGALDGASPLHQSDAQMTC